MKVHALSFPNIAFATGAVMVLLVGALFSFNVLFARADTMPAITSAIQNGTNTAVTSAPLGSGVHDFVTVASSTDSTAPTGTVNFNLYANTSCSGTPTVQSAVPLVSGAAQSSTSTVPATGLSYIVAYNGDANNVAATGTCEMLTATAPSPTLSTTLSTTTSVLVGSSIFDSATLSNATASAGGTVAYKVYSDNACSTLYQGAGSVNVTSGSVPNSNTVVFNTPGTYYWQAVYSGDSQNAVATSTCGSEALTVTALPPTTFTPTLSTTLSTTSAAVGSSVFDSATLASASSTAGGTVAYKVYSNNTCTTLNQSAGTVNVTNGSVPNSNTVVFNTPGTYYWQAVYSGDAKDAAATSTCGNEALIITSSTVTPPPSGTGMISGEVFNDLNSNETLDSGEPGLPGFTIQLTAASNTHSWWGWGNNSGQVVATTVTDGNGNYSFANLADGTYKVEEIDQSGWNQTTSDFTGVVISGSSSKTGLNFANTAASSTNNGNGKGGGDNDRDDNGGQNGGGIFCKGFPFCNGNPFGNGFPFNHAANNASVNHSDNQPGNPSTNGNGVKNSIKWGVDSHGRQGDR